MRKRTYALGMLIAWLAIIPAMAATDECRPNLVNFDACDFARRLRAEIAPSLPQQMDADMTWVSVLAAGPRIVAYINWHLSLAELRQTMHQSGKSMEALANDMSRATSRVVCSGPPLDAFIRLGGEVQYVYRTADFQLIASPLVTTCPMPR